MVGTVGSSSDIITNDAVFDWLTLTSYDPVWYAKMKELVLASPALGSLVNSKIMQYAGMRGDGFFFGAGSQKGTPHYMVRLSGIRSELLFDEIRADMFLRDCNCPRCDLQYTTLAKPVRPRTGFYRNVIHTYWRGNGKGEGRTPNVKVIMSDKPMDDTVYVGSRTSEKMIRIYDKPIEGEHYVRFEVEYKKDLANLVFQESLADPRGRADRLKRALPLPIWRLDPFTEFKGLAEAEGKEKAKIVRASTSLDASMEWVKTSVLPTLNRLAMSEKRAELAELLKLVLDLTGGV